MRGRYLVLCPVFLLASVISHTPSSPPLNQAFGLESALASFAPLQSIPATASGQQFPGATVQRDPKTGAIMMLEGNVCVQETRTTRESAERFLASQMGLNLLDNGLTRLALDRQVDTLTGTRLTYQSYYTKTYSGKELPMFGGTVSIFVGTDNCVKRVDNSIAHITKPDLIADNVSISKKHAEDVIKRELVTAGKKTYGRPAAQLGIIVSDGKPTLAWKLNVTTLQPPAALEFILDAHDGKILSAQNVAQYLDDGPK